MQRLVLVDAHALLYRYNFGGARLSAASGEDTSIAYGFIGTLLSLLEVQPPPTHFIVVLDAAGKTFRFRSCIAAQSSFLHWLYAAAIDPGVTLADMSFFRGIKGSDHRCPGASSSRSPASWSFWRLRCCCVTVLRQFTRHPINLSAGDGPARHAYQRPRGR